MSDVASARFAQTNPNHIVPIFTALPGLFLLFSGSNLAFGAAMLLFVFAGVYWFTQKPEYFVILKIKSSSADTRALASKDARSIVQVVQALNDSIAAGHRSRGHGPGWSRATVGTPSSAGTASAATGRENR